MDKLRQTLTAARQQVNHREEKQKAIVARLLPFLEGKTSIGLYMPAGSEADVVSMLDGLNKDLYVPAVLDETQMEFRAMENLKKSRFGILEPDTCHVISAKSLDVIIVPMVAFCGLHRLGHGAGYYDRYLLKTHALKIGIAFDIQEAAFEHQPWDVDMDVLITESRCMKKGEQ